MRKKTNKTNKKVKKEEKEIIVKNEEIGEVLPITADEDNPIGDGKEFDGGEEDE